MPIVEITTRCELRCPICIADAQGERDLSLEDFDRALDRVLAAEERIDVLNLSGGEPTLHPRFLDLVDAALAKPGIFGISVSTNGMQLSRSRPLVQALARRGVTVSLQFDGWDEPLDQLLRGRSMAGIRRAALDLLAEEDCRTSLVTTSVPDQDLRPALDLLFGRGHILSLMLQPLARTGRAAQLVDEDRPWGVAEAVAALTGTGHPAMRPGDFLPLPCSHPHCFALAYYLVTGPGRAVGVTSLFPADRMMDLVANRTVFGLEAEERQQLTDLVYELWSGPAGAAPDGQAVLASLRRLLADLPRCACGRSALDLLGRSAKSIFVHAFQDAHSFDLSRVRRCCNAYIQPDGSQIPVCVRNVLRR